MIWLWIIAFLTVFVAWYSSPIGRELLKKQWWMQWLYCSRFGEATERLLFSKSDTIAWARWKVFVGAAWQAIVQFGAIDMSPFLILIPQKYHTLVLALPSVILAADGVIQEIQRRWTTKPLVAVEVPETRPIPADVKAKLDEFEKAKKSLMATLETAKQTGEV